MAAPMYRLWAVAARGTYRVRPRPTFLSPLIAFRPFHPSRRRREEDSKPSQPPDPNSSSPSSHPAAPTTTQNAQSELVDEPVAAQDGTQMQMSEEDTNRMMDQEAERIVKEAFDEVEKEEGLEEDEEDRGGNDMFPPIPRDDAGAASPDRIKELLAQHPDPFDGKGPKTDEEIQAFLENPPEELRGDIERMQAELQKLESELAREFEDEMGDPLEEPLGRRERPGLLAMGDDDEMEMGDDELDEGDDMTSLGHGDLERHREMRDYARLIAWDMPLLSKFAKPFEPPTPETPLRFRFTSYMGETHPAEPKVVVEFCTADLPLEPRQRLKLVKLLGARYDPQQDLARMSCEQFRHAAQNKRYLVDLVNTLVTEARCQSDAEGGRDAFDDVPVDFRHVKWKKRLAFPEEWKMTPERKARLQEGWRRIEEEDKKRLEERTLVDGVLVIEKSREKLGAGAMPRNLRLPQGKPAGRGARQAKPEYAYAR